MFTHLVVPLADQPDTARAVFPAAAIARAFDATVVVVTHPSAGIDPEDVVDRVGTAEVAAVRLDVDTEMASALRRLAPAFGSPAVVCTAHLADVLIDEWPGPLLIFGGGSDPDGYSVGGTIIVDRSLHDVGDQELLGLAEAFGFAIEAVDDIGTATGTSGQVIVPRRDHRDAVNELVERWPGPIYLLAG